MSPFQTPCAGCDTGAQNWTIIEFLIETCKLNGIESHGCPSHVLTAMCEQHKQVDINELLHLS
jgi:hypothetical protein